MAGYDSNEMLNQVLPRIRVIALLLLGHLAVVNAPAVTLPQQVPNATAQSIPVAILPPMKDFGKVQPASRHPATFEIRNTGSSPLTIKSVVPSCKCTDVTQLAGTTIAPGGSVQLTATLDVPTTPGEKDAKVFITFEEYPAPVMALIKADASLPIRATPAYVDALKGVSSGVIQVASEDGAPFRILSAGSEAPRFNGFDPTKDAPRARYNLQWSTPTTPCEAMPLWWVIETDRADCPLVALRIRHECTGSKADPTKTDRYWFIPEPLGVAGRVAQGDSKVITMVIEHYNPKGRGAIVRPDWSQIKCVKSLSPKMTATLEGTRVGTKDDIALSIRVTPAPGVSGVLYEPIEIETASGKGVFAVSMQVMPQSAAPTVPVAPDAKSGQ